MISYIIKKITILLLSIFIVMSLTFLLIKSIPGDPFIQENVIPKEILHTLHKHYGLDQPLLSQYFSYLSNFLTGKFPPSMIYEGRNLTDIIKEGFPISALLGIEALLISLLIGFSIGAIGAFFHEKWMGHLAAIVGILGISIPSFLFATLLQYVFAIKLSIFPIARWGSLSQTVLPAIALSALPTAYIARLTRAKVMEILQQGYIKTAYAKGLSTFQIFFRHVFRNSLSPILAYIGPVSAHILTGSFVIEKIFAIPGLGQWFVTSILQRDYPIIMGLTIFYSSLLLACVFLIDLLMPLIDPRMEVQKI